MTSGGAAAAQRCVTHPGRRATDACPVCARPRCAVDAAAFATAGCPACVSPESSRPVAPARETGVRAGLAGLAAAFVGGWIAAQYVDTRYFSLIAPALLGLVAGWAVGAAAPGLSARLGSVVAAVSGVVGTGLSDRLVPGGQNLFLPVGHRLPPYVAAVVGAFLWPVLFGPSPGRRPAAQRGTRRK